MTKQEAFRYFREHILPSVRNDKAAIRSAWHGWTNSLHREGQITDRQVQAWLTPAEGRTRSSRGSAFGSRGRPAGWAHRSRDPESRIVKDYDRKNLYATRPIGNGFFWVIYHQGGSRKFPWKLYVTRPRRMFELITSGTTSNFQDSVKAADEMYEAVIAD